MSELISIREAGRRLGVSDTAVRKAIAADRIKVVDIVRDPAYVAATHAHDVALLLLDAPAKPTPMPLASAAQAAASVQPLPRRPRCDRG